MQETKSHQNHLIIFRHDSFEDQYTFSIFAAMLCAFTEDILILLFSPLVCGHNDGFIILKSMPSEWFI